MRDIKFRARVKWNGNHYESGEWIVGYYAYFDGQHQIYDCEETYISGIGDLTRYTWVEIDDNTLGQYTGLKDKNGVQIYEGDIVEYRWRAIGKTEDTVHCFEVRFGDGAFGQWEPGDGDNVIDLWYDWKEIEVIGNIYEHPELLEPAS